MTDPDPRRAVGGAGSVTDQTPRPPADGGRSMELTVEQPDLARALQTVARVAPVKFGPPFTRAVLLEAEPGRLALRATDLELGVATAAPATVAAPGRAAVPARLLAEYVARLPAGTVRLSLTEGGARLTATCAPYAAALATVDPTEFPELEAPTGDPGSEALEVELEVDAGALRGASARVAFAAARGETRGVFRSVLVAAGPGGLTLVASDGFRLARARVPAGVRGGGPLPEQELLVPARAVTEIGRVLAAAGDEAVRLAFRPDAPDLRLEAGETTVVVRLADGRFPDLERVVPQTWATGVAVETEALSRAVRVAGLFGTASRTAGTNGTGDVRPVVLRPTPRGLRLTARGAETGDAETELPATVYGRPEAVALDTRLLAEVLDAASAEWLQLAWQSTSSPVAIRERPSPPAPAPGGEVGGRGAGDEPDSRDVWVVMPLLLPLESAAPAAAPTAAGPPAVEAAAGAAAPADTTSAA
jgi:DNA polymerase-3 subunit beta